MKSKNSFCLYAVAMATFDAVGAATQVAVPADFINFMRRFIQKNFTIAW